MRSEVEENHDDRESYRYARNQTTQLVNGGVFDCDGYQSIGLDPPGEIKDPMPKGGKLGAILVPDVDPFTQAFQQLGLLPLTIEIQVTLKPGAGGYSMAEPKRADIGFPRYHVRFFNETGARSTPASSPSAAADRRRRSMPSPA